MKKKFTRFVCLLAAGILFSLSVFSQTAYRSIASGNWDNFAIWERTTNIFAATPTWVPATSGQVPTTNNYVFVRNGHSVSLNGSARNCLNLTVEAGGRLYAGGTTALRVGAPSSGFAGTVDTLRVDGILGGSGDLMALELPVGAASLWITGTGTIEIGRFRPLNGNLNFPGSASTNAASGARVIIDKDMKLAVNSNYALSLQNTAPSINDSLSMVIQAGRTVTISDPASYFHNDVSSLPGGGGKYVYNINGTLDLTANPSTTGGTKLVPLTNAASSIELNVNGTLKLGAYFKADTISTSQGAVYMNINNGGLVDASLTTNLITGTVGASAASPNIYFVVSGTGAIKRTVPADGTEIKFPIGISTSSYNPLRISNLTGPAEVYTVGLTNVPVVPPPALTLPRAWGVVKGSSAVNTVQMKFSWTTADVGASGFSASQPVYVGAWNGSSWETVLATVTGSGTPADPYIATASGTVASTAYILTNTNTTVPVVFVNVKGTKKAAGIQVEFSNATESDVKQYTIEKSNDGRNFTTLVVLQPKSNNGLLNNYSFVDNTPYKGNNFYRIKAQEFGGLVKISPVVSVNTERAGANVNVYPNPVKGNNVSIQLENLDKAVYTVDVFNNLGQKVFSKQINHDGNNTTIVADLPGAARAGVYSVQVSSTATRYIKSLIVE
jgi:hypothetical protein